MSSTRRGETLAVGPVIDACTASDRSRLASPPPAQTKGQTKGMKMRRLVAVAGLVGTFVLVGFTGWGSASVNKAHATSTVPLAILKAKDGETLALARVIVHGHAYPFLIDTGSSKTLVNTALAQKLHLKAVGRPIK